MRAPDPGREPSVPEPHPDIGPVIGYLAMAFALLLMSIA